MYWDGAKQTYIAAAADQSNTESAAISTIPSDSFASSGSKEKKDKPKTKTAQQVVNIFNIRCSVDRFGVRIALCCPYAVNSGPE